MLHAQSQSLRGRQCPKPNILEEREPLGAELIVFGVNKNAWNNSVAFIGLMFMDDVDVGVCAMNV